MEKEKYWNEDEEVLLPPYYIVIYIDDYNQRHMAMIKDPLYLKFLQGRYIVEDVKLVE